MGLVAKLDDMGKGAWIGLMVLSFIVFWPVGLAVLFFLIWSGRMACWKHARHGTWHDYRETGERRDRSKDLFKRWMGQARSTGNSAFDEYREETLKRLEDEQREFQGFLEKLRQAKDKAEFDQFMANRRGAPEPDAPPAA